MDDLTMHDRLVAAKAAILEALEADRSLPADADEASACERLTGTAHDVLHAVDELLADPTLWDRLLAQAGKVADLGPDGTAALYRYVDETLPRDLEALPWSVPPTLREFCDATLDALDTALGESHALGTQQERISEARRQLDSFAYRLRSVVRGKAGPDEPAHRRRVLRSLLRTAARTLPVFLIPSGPGGILTVTAGLELLTRWLRDESAHAPSRNLRHDLGTLSTRLGQIRRYALTLRDSYAAGRGTPELLASSVEDIRGVVFDAERLLRTVTDTAAVMGCLEGTLERDLDILAAGLREVRRRAGLAVHPDRDPAFEAQAVDSEVSEAGEALHHATLILQSTETRPRTTSTVGG